MYTNIPTNELLRIIDIACQNNYVKENLKQNIIKLTKTIIDQNYLQFLDMTHIQSEGLAMVSPTSSILPEFYLQYLENSKIVNLLLDHNIEGYFR
jgi:bifunctional pyridoxal-dependent enzyme with beta-cystathionase and maltose regulon repressor activities